MNLELATLLDHFYRLMWPMLRISALLLTAPVFSLRALNVRVRVLLALVLTLMIYPLFNWPRLDPLSAPGLLELLNQITLGALMGLMLQVVTGAILLAGQSISNAVGLSIATLIDPNMGNVPVVAQFLIVMSTLIFLGMGGHALLLALVVESFASLPIGKHLVSQQAWTGLLAWSSMVFLGGLLMALPIMVTLLFINIGLGVASRAAPALNIFSVGFPAMVVVGFGVLFISLPSIAARTQWLWTQAFAQVRQLLGQL